MSAHEPPTGPGEGDTARTRELPFSEPPPSRRRVWPWVLVSLVLVVLAGAVVVAEFAVRAGARDAVRDRIVDLLELDAATAVDVDLGDGLLLPQLVAGRIAVVDVVVPEAGLGDLRGAVEFHAEQVPLAEGGSVGRLDVRVSVGEDALEAVAADVFPVPVEQLDLEGDEVVVSTTVTVFGADVDAGLAVVPEVDAGSIVFTPSGFRIGDEVFGAGEGSGNAVVGVLARELLRLQELCVAEQLPESLALDSVEVVDDELVVTLTGSDTSLAPGAPRGTCG